MCPLVHCSHTFILVWPIWGSYKVVTWQDWREPDLIPSPRVQQMLQSNVVQLHASEDVFEAFRDDGTQISWGEAGVF